MFIFNHTKSFNGGVHPTENKSLTENLSFETMPVPKVVIVPLNQHLGKPAKPIVKKGSEVKAGEIIAGQDGFISSPVLVMGSIRELLGSRTILGYQVLPNGFEPLLVMILQAGAFLAFGLLMGFSNFYLERKKRIEQQELIAKFRKPEAKVEVKGMEA